MKRFIAIAWILSTAAPTLAAPTNDIQIIANRVCPMFNSGMTSGEVLSAVKTALETNAHGRTGTTRPAYNRDPYLRSVDRTLDETYRTLAKSTVETAVKAYCPNYSN